jgi:hypothetical protein
MLSVTCSFSRTPELRQGARCQVRHTVINTSYAIDTVIRKDAVLNANGARGCAVYMKPSPSNSIIAAIYTHFRPRIHLIERRRPLVACAIRSKLDEEWLLHKMRLWITTSNPRIPLPCSNKFRWSRRTGRQFRYTRCINGNRRLPTAIYNNNNQQTQRV